MVTTNEVNSATEAITLTTIPEGTVITLGESDVPISTDGQWNVTTGGSPTWTCTDTAGNDVVIDDSGQFTSTALNMTCVATNTFTLDPDPEPTPDPSESYDPEIAYSRGGELPNTGGSKHPMSLWATLWSAITSPFQN